MKITQIKNFMPDSIEGEAKELLMQALDWYNQNNPEQEKTKKSGEFKPIKLSNLSEQNFPPCVKNILKGISDGRKRALFVLINLFRSVGMDREELEKRIEDWNKKNEVPIKQGYIKSQLSWSFRKTPILPQNCKEFYKGIGVCDPDTLCSKIKNPVNYVVRKSFNGTIKQKTKDNFKNKS